jgi:hypothetical protein
VKPSRWRSISSATSVMVGSSRLAALPLDSPVRHLLA